jgi:2-dehydro-3-deoxyphosphogluconate aldolase/(4S)-4-hydroxy-2-oxoglutarate aldolase
VRSKERVVEALIGQGAVAVARLSDPERLDWLAGTLRAAGMEALEVTMTVPGAVEQIRRLADRLGPGHLVGVGSVRTAADAERAVDAGAAYVVSPVLEPEVLRVAAERGVPAMPGCFTPTEIHRAHEAGADIIKVFPADVLGMGFLRSVLAPMPGLKLMPTGGVTPENAGDWIRHGAVAVGVGGALLNPRTIADRDGDRLAGLAATLLRSVRTARAGREEGLS